MDLAVRRLLSLLVFFFHVSLLFSTAECGRTLHGEFGPGTLLGGWTMVEPVTPEEGTEGDTLHTAQGETTAVQLKSFEVDPEGTSIDVTEFSIENEMAEPPGVGENEASDPSTTTIMDVTPRSFPSVAPPIATQPVSLQTPARKKAQSPISEASLSPLAIGMLIMAAIAVGLMLGAIGGLFFLRLMRDNK